MKMLDLPDTDLTASNIVLGLMRIAEMDDEAVRTLVRTAMDEGVNMFDHADVYGGDHLCERRFGEAMRFSPAERDRVILQSKAGIRDGSYDFSTEHLLSTVEASLAALHTDRLDVLLLHRPDALVEPDEVAAAFDKLEADGKVLSFGVSNHTPEQIRLLRTAVRQPLAFDQLQLSIPHAGLVAQGVAMNMQAEDQSVDRALGILDWARVERITVQAWSPFQGGFFTGAFVGDRDRYPDLNDVLDELAAKYDVTPTGIATAWLTRHPAHLQVILGTTTPQRVRDAAAGSELPLTRAEWYRLFTAAGNIVP